MTHEEALETIWKMQQEDSRLTGVFSDLLYLIQHPDHFKGFPSKIAHAHAGESTVWSVKRYAQMRERIAGNLMLARGYKDIYMHTGEWDVCDECGEIALCSFQVSLYSSDCVYCRAKKWVERCCDKSEYLDSPIMRHYLHTGEINPLLDFISKDLFQMDATPKIQLKRMTKEEREYLERQFASLESSSIEPAY